MSKNNFHDDKALINKRPTFSQVAPDYCCLDLYRAVTSGMFTEVVSGILYYPRNREEKGCGDEVRISYCPFCAARIITSHNDGTWTWRTEKKEI